MKIQNSTIFAQTTHDTDIIHITPQVKEIVLQSNIDSGNITLFVTIQVGTKAQSTKGTK